VADTRMANVKGIALLHRRDFVVERFGEEGLKTVVAGLSAETARLLSIACASEWYPLQTIVDVDLSIVAAFFKGDFSAAAQMGFYDMDRAVKVVYRLMFRFLGPEVLISKQAALWGRMLDQGALEIGESKPGSMQIRIVGLNPLHEVRCHSFSGAFSGALAAAGRKNVTTRHLECVLKGAPACLYQVTYDA
jgi:hypothetical protein